MFFYYLFFLWRLINFQLQLVRFSHIPVDLSGKFVIVPELDLQFTGPIAEIVHKAVPQLFLIMRAALIFDSKDIPSKRDEVLVLLEINIETFVVAELELRNIGPERNFYYFFVLG